MLRPKGEGVSVKIIRWAVPGLGALVVAGVAAYVLMLPRAGGAPVTPPTPARPMAAALSRVAPWSHVPSSRSSGWVREQWIMKNQPGWIQREWRAAACPPLRYSPGLYYYYFDPGLPAYDGGNITVDPPPITVSRSLPPWWGMPIPPTGFPQPDRGGC